MLTRIMTTTIYQAVCECGNSYGEEHDNEMEAQQLIKEFPLCSDCEDS